MKKVLLLALCFIMVASFAYAHPPSDIKVTFDPQTQEVKAVIFHNVSDVNKHYIKKVDIGLNGKEIAELKFKKQDKLSTQEVTYIMSKVKAGDKITVEAYCNLSGKLEKGIVVK